MNNKICVLCNGTFDYQCGEFSIHLKEKHKISREQYIVLTQYNNIHPKCECGYCVDDSEFIPRKNLFHIINPSHRKFDWLEEKYIEKNGIPLCIGCNENPVSFKRGMPNSYCSQSCHPSNWNQDKINKTVLEKYGVTNVMHINSVKEKVGEKSHNSWVNNGKNRDVKTKATKLERYGNENYVNIEKIKETCLKNCGFDTFFKTEEFRQASSKRMVERLTSGKIEFFTKKYKDYDLYYQSSYEYRFLEHCENNNIIDLITRSKSFKFLEEDNVNRKRHVPDFLFKSKNIIEIKSTYILGLQGGAEILEAKKRSVERLGYVYLLVLDNNFTEFNILSGISLK